ncbi:MAG TPA: ATP-dependent RecD-like DNA helicase, partial [Planctomycetota bacterium]|nr:ATP-dependent RecD-like DNA helicase [Planctomycetota bacterium]
CLEGVLEHIIYSTPETNYMVARLRLDENEPPITITGFIMEANQGEDIRVLGKWVHHPKYGEQFKVEHFEVLLPSSKEQIIQYLSSGIIKGIGPALAKRIVKLFGHETFDVFERDISQLMNVSGIGRAKLGVISASWQEQRTMHDALLFLSSYGIRGKRAAKICDFYGGNIVAILHHHPYRLAIDIDGIGFITADKIAQRVGVKEDDPERIQAALIHIMTTAQSNSHCYLPEEVLVQTAINMLHLDESLILESIESLVQEKKLIRLEEDDRAIYRPNLYFYEGKVALILHDFVHSRAVKSIANIDKKIKDVQKNIGFHFVEKQQQAIKKALSKKFSIITGGPGVGKTTIIRALVDILENERRVVALAAPTGRAAKRLSEATQFAASTIHRLLRFNPFTKKFEYNSETPLKIDHLIVDEASMIDIILAYQLFSAVPLSSSITLVGDADQLPSVGPGNVLGDLIASKKFPVVQLDHIFRQSKGSSIVEVAHDINHGMIPKITNQPDSDIYFFLEDNPKLCMKSIVDLVGYRLPKQYNFHPIRDIQVLSPMYRGAIGVDKLNEELAKALNPPTRGSYGKFRVGDKVMQIVNNYEKNVYNGDIGIIHHIDRSKRKTYIQFDELIEYEETDLSEIVYAYAISIHKSQGSEYPCVIIPLHTEHFIMLERNLLYTAITRGKELVILIGTWKAFIIAIQKIRARDRYTKLVERLIAE